MLRTALMNNLFRVVALVDVGLFWSKGDIVADLVSHRTKQFVVNRVTDGAVLVWRGFGGFGSICNQIILIKESYSESRLGFLVYESYDVGSAFASYEQLKLQTHNFWISSSPASSHLSEYPPCTPS